MLFHHASDVHDAALLRTLRHVVEGDARQESRMDHVHTRHLADLFGRQLVDGSRIGEASVVDQHRDVLALENRLELLLVSANVRELGEVLYFEGDLNWLVGSVEMVKDRLPCLFESLLRPGHHYQVELLFG